MYYFMKTLKTLTTALLLTGFFMTSSSFAEEAKKPEKNKPYPMTTCIVSGEKLGEMGKPFIYTHEGREVQFCCKSCLKDFKKEPAKYLKKLDEAEKAAKK